MSRSIGNKQTQIIVRCSRTSAGTHAVGDGDDANKRVRGQRVQGGRERELDQLEKVRPGGSVDQRNEHWPPLLRRWKRAGHRLVPCITTLIRRTS